MDLFKVYPTMNIELEKGSGSWVFDTAGQRYLDLYGGHAVISIGHSHPHYVSRLKDQIDKIGFYSNAVKNSIQKELASKLGEISGLEEYQLFLCNSGAEANEAALKLASYHTGKQGIIAIKNGFHGRTAGALGVTSSPSISVPSKPLHNVYFSEINDFEQLRNIFDRNEIGAVIMECIQGIGGINIVDEHFYNSVSKLCKQSGALLIADEVQSGFGRSGQFFSFQHFNSGSQPDLISVAKGMGNGFPIGGTLISPEIEPRSGLLGSTFGGNYLACNAALAVLEVMQSENLIENAALTGNYFMDKTKDLKGLKEVRGLGLMIGLEFKFPVKELRNEITNGYRILTGSSSNPNVLRILPPLNVTTDELDIFISALNEILKEEKYHEAVYNN